MEAFASRKTFLKLAGRPGRYHGKCDRKVGMGQYL